MKRDIINFIIFICIWIFGVGGFALVQISDNVSMQIRGLSGMIFYLAVVFMMDRQEH